MHILELSIYLLVRDSFMIMFVEGLSALKYIVWSDWIHLYAMLKTS